MVLYIRTEANRITATGHMMRCMAIADAASEKGIETIFIVAEECSERFPVERGYRTICLHRRWDDFDGEIPVMEQLIKENQIEVLLIDSYFVSYKYMEAVSKATKTAYIDDLHAFVWPCSILINYAVYYDLYDYAGEYPGTKLLLGCSFAPLRKEYVNLPRKKIRQKIKKVLVVTGGTDEFHFMKQFAGQLLLERTAFPDVEFHLVCGTYNRDLDEIRRLTLEYDEETTHRTSSEPPMKIKIYEALPTLKDMMTEADLLVTAGGTTLYEMAACGVPGICFSIADNQMENVKGFAKRGLVRYAGDARKDFSYAYLLQILKELMQDTECRIEMADRLQTLVDGNGAERIVDELFHV